MVFHARKYGWKQIAARLLLVPVLTGASAAVAHAQFNPVPTQASGANMPATPPGDAKAMLKEGRKALAAGQYDRAQDLARAAEANNPSGKWGLFDTPNALLKDVQAAVAKAQKTQAEQMVKQAKGLYTKSTQSEGERTANLDQALALAQRADQLHGPYSAWGHGRPARQARQGHSGRARQAQRHAADLRNARDRQHRERQWSDPAVPPGRWNRHADHRRDAREERSEENGAMQLMAEGRSSSIRISSPPLCGSTWKRNVSASRSARPSITPASPCKT